MFIEMLIIFLVTPLIVVGGWAIYHLCRDITHNKIFAVIVFIVYVVLFVLFLFSIREMKV